MFRIRRKAPIATAPPVVAPILADRPIRVVHVPEEDLSSFMRRNRADIVRSAPATIMPGGYWITVYGTPA